MTTVSTKEGTYFYSESGNLLAFKGTNAPTCPELSFTIANA